MPVEIGGFAQALARCMDFDTVEPPELEAVLTEATAALEMQFAEPSAESTLIRSGSLFTHLLFVQHGTIVPLQYPYSELDAPFLIGEHEFLMDAERWVASYSSVTEAIVVWIPVALMQLVVDRIPRVRDRMHQLVMRRLARFYWTSLATSGTTSSRVAAALVSRTCPLERRLWPGSRNPDQAEGPYSPDCDVPLRCRRRGSCIGERTGNPTRWPRRCQHIKIWGRCNGSRCRPFERSCVCRGSGEGDPIFALSA